MKKFILFIVLIGSIVSCQKEETIEPFEEMSWYFIEYRDNMDEVDQKIYDIYEKHGVAVFYKDTIGVEDRGWKDINGNTNYYYEILKIGYNPVGESLENIKYELIDTSSLEKKKELLPLLDIIDLYLLPSIVSSDFYLPCIFAVEYMNYSTNDYLVKRSFNFMALAKNQLIKGGMGDAKNYIYEFWIEILTKATSLSIFRDIIAGSMDDLDIQQSLKTDAFAKPLTTYDKDFEKYYGYLLDYEKALDELPQLEKNRDELLDLLSMFDPSDPIYDVLAESYEKANMAVLEQEEIINKWNDDYSDDFYSIYNKKLHTFGFLQYSPSLGDGRNYFPTRDEDLLMYVELLFSKTEEEVAQEWSEFPYVLARHQFLYSELIEMGVDIDSIINIVKNINK